MFHVKQSKIFFRRPDGSEELFHVKQRRKIPAVMFHVKQQRSFPAKMFHVKHSGRGSLPRQ